jgi:16S rRNA G966 N2-methylase RsmD
MSQFFATFPAGTFDVIAKQLKAFTLDELTIIDHDDSSIVFASTLRFERLIEMRYFTNVYLIVDDLKSLPPTVVKGRFFRLMLLREGVPQPMSGGERSKLEAKIRRTFGLSPGAQPAANDFYLIERASGKKLLTFRLARAKFKREKLAAGELRPELAHILCLAAGLKAKHVLLDAFAGYGAIPFEAVRGFGCKQVIAIDNQQLADRHEHPAIQWHQADSRRMAVVGDDSIDRVVTDPPWGVYDQDSDTALLYQEFAKELERVLRPDGVAIILSGYQEAGYHLVAGKIRLVSSWPVLVSGKKATIYKLQKIV